MKMEGEISELSVTKPESGAKAELGGVSACAIEVAQAVPPPMIEPVHPEGRVGAATPSKFSENATTGTVAPSLRINVAAPRFRVPSASSRTGVIVPPQSPLAVKTNVRETVAPFVRVPYRSAPPR